MAQNTAKGGVAAAAIVAAVGGFLIHNLNSETHDAADLLPAAATVAVPDITSDTKSTLAATLPGTIGNNKASFNPDGSEPELSRTSAGEQANNAVSDVSRTVPANIPFSQAHQNSPAQNTNNPEMSAFNFIFADAKPNIISALLVNTGPLTKDEVTNIVANQLGTSAAMAARSNPTKYQFDIMSGVLTLNLKHTIGSIELQADQINLYQISGGLAGAVMGCEILADPDTQAKPPSCLSNALDKAREVVDEGFDKLQLSSTTIKQ